MPYYNGDPKRDHNFDNHPSVTGTTMPPNWRPSQLQGAPHEKEYAILVGGGAPYFFFFGHSSLKVMGIEAHDLLVHAVPLLQPPNLTGSCGPCLE